MKRRYGKSVWMIVLLTGLTGMAMAYARNHPGTAANNPHTVSDNHGKVTASVTLTQSKILQGSDGKFTVSLDTAAEKEIMPDQVRKRHVDMVIVLDRSGSMQGRKLEDARRAVLDLLTRLSANDRFALISYSDGVRKHSDLIPVTASSHRRIEQMVNRIRAGGSTHLSAGLQTGIDTLTAAESVGNTGKVILISDGLANRGVTDPERIARMASVAVSREFAVSAVGVGNDFNEYLMTAIADRGAGTYYYLDNPAAFARVFETELGSSRACVASSIEVRIPLKNSIKLVDAAGYPIERRDGCAVFYTGSLQTGSRRKLFLTFRMPTDRPRQVSLEPISIRYVKDGQPCELLFDERPAIACVKDPNQVASSIDKSRWEEKVLTDDYNRLKQEVARDIKAGRPASAMTRIDSYYRRQQAVNAHVGSEKVADNLETDVEQLKSTVAETFRGKAEDVIEKRKKQAKSLQYEGYQGRRTIK